MAMAAARIFLVLALVLAIFSSGTRARSPAADEDFVRAVGELAAAKRFTKFLSSIDLLAHLRELDEVTIFVPNDGAFSFAPDLTGDELSKIVRYHILPRYHSYSALSEMEFPVSTVASGKDSSAYQLMEINGDLIASGQNYAEISSVVFDRKASVVVYEIDNVLIPLEHAHDSCQEHAAAPSPSPLVAPLPPPTQVPPSSSPLPSPSPSPAPTEASFPPLPSSSPSPAPIEVSLPQSPLPPPTTPLPLPSSSPLPVSLPEVSFPPRPTEASPPPPPPLAFSGSSSPKLLSWLVYVAALLALVC
ncbi:fasciclin-like arabinogalactan protein 8 [Selaginella moellendorffii]|uniref:fasciclin-like arabinogalactan protein 8 n=1 Tax=Selaginella moellendorffii TaxID=88036 RepID=UPI000D1CF465|nr:fasciclin-like arabinogalactan protein 8 [Selaginella moellendorffii]|eukprot:XP_024521795.1 fasciclin-like arabinogalactan protein 8 [Selaginella moellendorffii]